MQERQDVEYVGYKKNMNEDAGGILRMQNKQDPSSRGSSISFLSVLTYLWYVPNLTFYFPTLTLFLLSHLRLIFSSPMSVQALLRTQNQYRLYHHSSLLKQSTKQVSVSGLGNTDFTTEHFITMWPLAPVNSKSGTQGYLNPLYKFDLEFNVCQLFFRPSAGSVFSEASAGQHSAPSPDVPESTADGFAIYLPYNCRL